MHIIVCIKSVVRSAPGGVARRTLDNSELNLFDRPALEAAMQIKETAGATVTALSMGPSVGSAVLAEARAMGADRAVLINDRALAGSDTLITARVLAAAVTRLAPFDFLFFGVRTSDSDTGQVGPQTAALLSLPFVSGVRRLKADDNGWDVERVMDDWVEQWRVTLPAALTIDARSFSPRHIGLPGLAAVYDEPALEQWGLTDLNLTADQVGLEGSPTRVSALHHIKHSRSCELLTGEPRQQIEALVKRLSNKGLMGS
jgi:electron transfer flavoprotein beta subunit